MRYDPPQPITKDSVLAALSGPEEKASEALIRAALTINDRLWLESTLLNALTDCRVEVRRAALLSFGHIARIHRQLSLEEVLPRIESYRGDEVLGGTAEDALDDIATFLNPGRESRS